MGSLHLYFIKLGKEHLERMIGMESEWNLGLRRTALGKCRPEPKYDTTTWAVQASELLKRGNHPPTLATKEN